MWRQGWLLFWEGVSISLFLSDEEMDNCYLGIFSLFWLVTNVLKNLNMSMCLCTLLYTIDKNYFFQNRAYEGAQNRKVQYNVFITATKRPTTVLY